MELANVTWQRDKPLVEKGWFMLRKTILTLNSQNGRAQLGPEAIPLSKSASKLAGLTRVAGYSNSAATRSYR